MTAQGDDGAPQNLRGVEDKIVIAPDKFKGSLTATEAARAIERGVLKARPQARCEICPMADGGEGTVD
ncbi:MAG: glycerate kinase, partial [Candidatus Cybelea sp.]